jgi:hypothetical protein
MDANPLERLMNDAAAAVARDVSLRRHTAAATEVWPTEGEVTALCASLAGTSSAQRARFREELRHRQRVVLGRFGARSATIALRERSPARLRSSTKPRPSRTLTPRPCYAPSDGVPT